MPERLSRIKRLQREFVSGLQDRWSGEQEENLSPGEKFVRFWAFVGRSFSHNRLPIRSAALTYATLLAIVPLLAVAISIATALLKTEKGQEQVDQQVERLIDDAISKFAPQLDLEVKKETSSSTARIVAPKSPAPRQASATNVSDGKIEAPDLELEKPETNTVEVAVSNRSEVTRTIRSSITNIQSGKLGVSATIVLVFIAISLLTSVENTLNDIWGIKRGRTWLSRIVQYWAVITLGPILLLAGIALSAKRNLALSGWVPGAEIMNAVVSEFVPLIVFTFVFSLLYRLMPNTKVENRAALVGGFVGGLLLYLNNKFSMIYFGQVARNFEIYGSLGTIPVFLVGLYFSWMILLLGAQVAYAYQNRKAYFQEKQAENINERGREFVALRIMTLIAQRFAKAERPPSVTEISQQLVIPTRLVTKIVEPLVQTRLLVEVKTDEKSETAYDPGRPLENISYQNILEAVRTGLGQQVPTKDDDMRKVVTQNFDQIRAAESQVGNSISLRDIVLNLK